MTSPAGRPPTATADPWQALRRWTPARIALGRAGASLPTREVLAFALAHAQARDAVHAAIDAEALAARVGALGLKPVILGTEATSRADYLSRPDHGRTLTAASRERLLAASGEPAELAVVIGDGLSASAVMAHAVPLLGAIAARATKDVSVASTVAIVRGARVAVADEIGAILGARLGAILIGERPGLSAPDSLGLYLTYAPVRGRTDAERNCISNIRPEGLPIDVAAQKAVWLARAALQRGFTGVALKDESGAITDEAGAHLALGPGTERA